MFRLIKIVFYLFVAWALFGCVDTDPVTRRAAPDAAPLATPLAPGAGRDWGAAELVVTVPEALVVSESNSMRPVADIVWQEDPAGDRHLQVQEIMSTALLPAIATLDGATPVRIEIRVTRFHALSTRARHTIGGTHEIAFDLRVRHGETGAVLLPVRSVALEFDAYGGRQAIEAEAAGQTQRARITDHLRDWARDAFGLGAGADAA